MKLLIWKRIVQFRFRNKKYVEIFNKLGKRFKFVLKGIYIKMTYYYSVWIPQTLVFDVIKAIRGVFK